MNTTNAIGTVTTTSPKAILWAGLVAGTMDITAAFVVYGFLGATPLRILQGIASGLIGPRAYEAGAASAILGLLCHFTIASGAAMVFFLASRHIPFLTRHFVLAGVLYGIAVYFFMARVVIPLSRVHRGPFQFKMMLISIVIHIFCIGLPIATIVKRYSRGLSSSI
jgi:phage shock protein PspC (stress-responsive transcriptional regulator)